MSVKRSVLDDDLTDYAVGHLVGMSVSGWDASAAAAATRDHMHDLVDAAVDAAQAEVSWNESEGGDD